MVAPGVEVSGSALDAFRSGDLALAAARLESLRDEGRWDADTALLHATVLRARQLPFHDAAREATTLAPDDAAIHLRAARLVGWGAGFGSAGDAENATVDDLRPAVAWMKRAAELSPDDPDVQRSRDGLMHRWASQPEGLAAIEADDDPADAVWAAAGRIRMARVALAARRPLQALSHATAAVAWNPNDAAARVVLFEAQLWLRRLPEAFANLEAAIRLTPDDLGLRMRAARALAGQRDPQRALHHVVAGRTLAPDHPELLQCHADLAVHLLPREEALAAADAAHTPSTWRASVARYVPLGAMGTAREIVDAALVARAPGALAVAARLALWRDDPAALELATRARAEDPSGAEPAHVLGAVFVRQGDPLRAIKALKAAISRLRKRPDPDGWLTEDAAATWLCAAYSAAGQPAQAHVWGTQAMTTAHSYNVAAHLQRLITAVAPTDDPTRILSRDAWARLAAKVRPLVDDEQQLDAGTQHGVIAQLESALRRFGGNRSPWATTVEDGILSRYAVPPHPRAEGRRLQHLLKTRPEEEVLARFPPLQARFPDDPTPLTYHGELLVWLGRPTEAEAVFRRAIALQHSTTWAWIGLGAATLLAGDPAGAIAVLAEGAVASDYEGPTLFLYRAEAHLQLGELDAADADLAIAIASKPQRLSAWMLRARVWAARGDLSPARQVLAAIAAHAPGLATDLAHLEGEDTRLEAALGWMRGNRSSTLVCYERPGHPLRFVTWGRHLVLNAVFPPR